MNTPRTPDLEQSLKAVLRLRRAFRAAPDDLREDIGPALTQLEELIGQTISKRKAAELLGISHTALNRWVKNGEIASTPNDSGRDQIPVAQVVDLLDRIGRPDDRSGGLTTIVDVIRDQRRKAGETATKDILPPHVLSRPWHGHRRAELRSLGYHRVLASRLDEATIAEARRRLQHWIERDAIHPTWAARWKRVLDKSCEDIATTISSDSEDARELRQSSPFAGQLTAQEQKRLQQALQELER